MMTPLTARLVTELRDAEADLLTAKERAKRARATLAAHVGATQRDLDARLPALLAEAGRVDTTEPQP